MTIRESSLSVEADEATERNKRDVAVADTASAANTPTLPGSLYASQVSSAKGLESNYVNVKVGDKMMNPFNYESCETVEYVNIRSYVSSPDSDNVYHVPRPTLLSSTSMSRLFPVLSVNEESPIRLMSKLSVSPEAQSASEYAMSPVTTPDSECALSSSSENLNASSGSDGSMNRGSGSRIQAISQSPRRSCTVNVCKNEFHYNPTEQKQTGHRSAFPNHRHDAAVKSRSVPAGLSPTLAQVEEEGISRGWSSFHHSREWHTPGVPAASASMASPGSRLKPRPVQQHLHHLVQAEDQHHAEEDGEERIYEEIRDSSPVRIEMVDPVTSFRPRPRPNTLDLNSSQMKTSHPVLIPGRRVCPSASSPKEEMLQKQAEFVKLHHMLHAQKLHQDGDFLFYEQAWDGRPVVVRKHAGIGAHPKSSSLSPTAELDRHGIKNHQYLTPFSCVIPTKPAWPDRTGRLQRAISLQDLRRDKSLNELNPCFQRSGEASSFERDRGKSASAGETKPRNALAVRESLRLREPKSKHLAYDRRKPDSDETARKVVSKKERMQIEVSDYRRNNWDRFDECMRSKRLEKDRAKRPAQEIGWPMDLQSMSKNKQKQLTDMIEEIRKVLPDATPAECLEGLRHSGNRPDDAAMHVLVKRLSDCRYGFTFEQCKKVLSDCHGDFDEAKRSLKAQYLSDRFRELDQSQCRAVLMETDWNLVASVKKIYVQNCLAIGIDSTRGNAILFECGNNVTRAIEAMKVARATEITGRPEDECLKTLSLCQWNLERAVDLILKDS